MSAGTARRSSKAAARRLIKLQIVFSNAQSFAEMSRALSELEYVLISHSFVLSVRSLIDDIVQ